MNMYVPHIEFTISLIDPVLSCQYYVIKGIVFQAKLSKDGHVFWKVIKDYKHVNSL